MRLQTALKDKANWTETTITEINPSKAKYEEWDEQRPGSPLHNSRKSEGGDALCKALGHDKISNQSIEETSMGNSGNPQKHHQRGDET